MADLSAAASQPLPICGATVLVSLSPNTAVVNVGIARAGLYPRLSRSDAITLNAIGESGNADYFFVLVAQFPSLDQTTEQAVVLAREANVRQTHAQWYNTMLMAILEVDSALVACQAAHRAFGSAMRLRQPYSKTLALAHDLYQLRNVTLSEMIDAEQAFAKATPTWLNRAGRRHFSSSS